MDNEIRQLERYLLSNPQDFDSHDRLLQLLQRGGLTDAYYAKLAALIEELRKDERASLGFSPDANTSLKELYRFQEWFVYFIMLSEKDPSISKSSKEERYELRVNYQVRWSEIRRSREKKEWVAFYDVEPSKARKHISRVEGLRPRNATAGWSTPYEDHSSIWSYYGRTACLISQPYKRTDEWNHQFMMECDDFATKKQVGLIVRENGWHNPETMLVEYWYPPKLGVIIAMKRNLIIPKFESPIIWQNEIVQNMFDRRVRRAGHVTSPTISS